MTNSLLRPTQITVAGRAFELMPTIYGEYDIVENGRKIAHAVGLVRAVEYAEEMAHGNSIHTCRYCRMCNIYHTENGAARYFCSAYKHSLDTLKPCVLWRDRE